MSLPNVIEDQYFEWLYDYVCRGRVNEYISYRKLFMMLYDTEFTYIIPNDENRVADGEYMRYRFASQFEVFEGFSLPQAIDGPVSILEMMIGLAVRVEEETMSDTRYGDRTAQWFWCMLGNMGLGGMTDDIFDRDYVHDKLELFLNRQYSPDGRGGLFYIRNCEADLRYVEIWTQCCWYLNNFI